MPRRSYIRSNFSRVRLKRLLQDRFGLDEFRPGQEEVIRNVLRGVDTLAVMPTGAGKSLCYQLPGLFLPGTTVVVSPLIALMNDQADKLEQQGVNIALVNSTRSRSDEMQTMNQIDRQVSEIVFVTPERLQLPEMIEILSRIPIDILVIDEAHCISQWGHDFRPAFLEIPYVLDALGNPPILALTATATEEVAIDIRTQLGRPQMAIINASVYRPNLHFSVKQVLKESEKITALERLLTQIKGTCIIYTATVKAAEAVHEHLLRVGYPAFLYHGRMRSHERRASHEHFMMQPNCIMIATNAFGLGIDKPDVRAVIHYQMPSSLEAYYQESGRAGRDGDIARCELLFDSSDRRIQTFFLAGRCISLHDIQQLWKNLIIEASSPSMRKVSQVAALAKDMPTTKARVAFKVLLDANLLQVERGRYVPLVEKIDDEIAEQLVENYNQHFKVDRSKLEQLVAYAYSARCRWLTLMEYFGETPDLENCGTCDNCLNPPLATLEKQESHAPACLQTSKEPGFELGQYVKVRRYGAGTIAAIAGEVITIAFPDGRRRPFLHTFVSPGGRK